MGTEGGVLTVVETGITGEPTVASLETLSAARTLSESLGRPLAAAIMAGPGSMAGHGLAGRGVQRVYELRCAAKSPLGTEAAWAAIAAAHPLAVLLPGSPVGRAIAAVTAARMACELVSGCTLIGSRNGGIQLGRPCLSGRAFAQFEWDRSNPVVVTVAQGAFSAPAADAKGNADPEVIAIDVPAPQEVSSVTVLSEIAPSPEVMGVNDADVLVAGGAGVGGPEGFGLLTELARRLGGTVAASRVAVDRGWVPSERQVGLTGRTVAPNVYLAFGISGAPQHIAGIRSAGKVVAINRDPNAPIFDVADLAIVADLHELVPELLGRLTNVEPELNGKEH